MENILEKLPEIGTKLDDMTFEQIKAIAVAGKTTEYGIIVGRQIKINDDLKAEIVNIGDDYIELLTTTPVLSATLNDNKIFLANNKKVLFNAKSSFYKMPQVNYKDKQSQQICFIGSCVQKELLNDSRKKIDEFDDQIVKDFVKSKSDEKETKIVSMKVSAKTGVNIKSLFEKLIKEYLKKEFNYSIRQGTLQSAGSFNISKKKKQKKQNCCE